MVHETSRRELKLGSYFPMLNDWCRCLDLHIGRNDSELFLKLDGPERQTLNDDRTIQYKIKNNIYLPVTRDKKIILKILGFKDPETVLKGLESSETDRNACSVLCGSMIFRPSMAKNTNCGKFSGYSTLYSYIMETFRQGQVRGRAWAIYEDREIHSTIRATAHKIIERLYPMIVPRREAFINIEKMEDKIEEILWRPSASKRTCTDRARRGYESCWKNYKTLRGLQNLYERCTNDPDAAMIDWLEFQDDSMYDWKSQSEYSQPPF